MAHKKDSNESGCLRAFLVTGLFLLMVATTILAAIPTDVRYSNHGTGTYLDVVLFELSRQDGLWDYREWAYLPVSYVRIHHGNTIWRGNVTNFRDSANPYTVTEICDQYHKFSSGGTTYYVFACPIVDGNVEYYPDNQTLEYWIDERFGFVGRDNAEVYIR